MMFKGSIPALVTPFRDGRLDESALRGLVNWQIESGSSALAPCGTTSEGSTLTDTKRERIVAICVEQAGGRVPIIAGCGTNDTARTLRYIHEAKACGAQAALVVVPYYTRPSEAGLLAHFTHLAEQGSLPIVLYNVPGRTITDLRPHLVIELVRRFPDVFIGLKDASGDIARVADHRDGLVNPERFSLLSGDDKTCLAFNASGGQGCISVTANVAPTLCAEFQAACAANDFVLARAIDQVLHPLHCAMFVDSSPAPCKYALSRLVPGVTDEVRLPLVSCAGKSQAFIDAALDLLHGEWGAGQHRAPVCNCYDQFDETRSRT